MKFPSLHRLPTFAEHERLADQYDAHWNCDDGFTAVMTGGDDPEALNLSAGQVYSTLVYNPTTDTYSWNHDNVVESPETETAYDLTDAQCDRFHARYELI